MIVQLSDTCGMEFAYWTWQRSWQLEKGGKHPTQRGT